ncbi:MAG TPA: Sec-independent protein translocase protein TatB [Luteimonas sp.]
MFDLGFGELLLVALVALVVLGPERLPKAARFAGLWVRRARAQWYSVRSELERELAAEELKRNLDAARTASSDFERQARDAVTGLDASVRKADADTRNSLRALRDDLVATADGTAPGPGTGAGVPPAESSDDPAGPVSDIGAAPAADVAPPVPDGDADGRR